MTSWLVINDLSVITNLPMMTESLEDTSKSVHVAIRTAGLKVGCRYNEELSITCEKAHRGIPVNPSTKPNYGPIWSMVYSFNQIVLPKYTIYSPQVF